MTSQDQSEDPSPETRGHSQNDYHAWLSTFLSNMTEDEIAALSPQQIKALVEALS